MECSQGGNMDCYDDLQRLDWLEIDMCSLSSWYSGSIWEPKLMSVSQDEALSSMFTDWAVSWSVIS